MSKATNIFYRVFSQVSSQIQVSCSHLRISVTAIALVFAFLCHRKPTKVMGIQGSGQAESANSKILPQDTIIL